MTIWGYPSQYSGDCRNLWGFLSTNSMKGRQTEGFEHCTIAPCQRVSDLLGAERQRQEKFGAVFYVPGNHELLAQGASGTETIALVPKRKRKRRHVVHPT